MTDGLSEMYRGRDRARQRQIWVTAVLSLLIHALALWGVPRVRMPEFGAPELGEGRGALVVQLAPIPIPAQPPRPPPVPAVQPAPPAQVKLPAVAQSRPAPPVLALKPPGPGSSASAAPGALPDAVPPRPQVEGDLSSYIEARRRARGETAPAAVSSGASSTAPAEDDNARANRIAAANLAAQQQSTFGYDPKRGGGIFHIEWLGGDSGAFLFYGWNPEVRRNTAQVIEVRRGEHSDIRIAIVRRMIAIIREHENGDFQWQSPRLGRTVTLSARARDSTALEEFMMREFFSGRWKP